MKKTFSVLLLAVFTAFSGCATLPETKSMNDRDASYSDKLLLIIKTLNKSLPESMSAELSLIYYNQGRKVTAKGDLSYTASPQSVRLKVSDPFLKFLIADAVLFDNKMKLFVPTENSLYVLSSVKDGILKPGINPSFISSVALGYIPVISYTEKKSFSDDKNRDVLELKNSSYEQTILFEHNYPARTVINNILTKEKTEIIYSDAIIKDGITLFGRIRAYSEPDGNFFEITYKNFKFNIKANPGTFIMNVPPNTKTITR